MKKKMKRLKQNFVFAFTGAIQHAVGKISAANLVQFR